VLGGVGLDLRAVERHVPELHQPRRAAQPQHLHEQRAQRREVPAAELRDRAEIGTAHAGHRHEVHPLLARPLQLARRIDAAAVTIEQQRHHQRRMIGRIAALLAIAREDRSKVKLRADRLTDEVSRVLRRHEILDRRRKQPHLVHVPSSKGLAHAP